MGREASARPYGRWSLGALISGLLLLGIAATALAVTDARDRAQESDARQAELAATKLSASLLESVAALRGIDGLLGDDVVSEGEFSLLAEDVLAGSLYTALAYARIVPDDQRAEWERTAGVAVRDTDGAGGFVPAAPRPEHYVVSVVHPSTAATRAIIGFDIASDAVRLRGARTAIEQDAPVVVGPISLASSARPGLFVIEVARDASGAPVGFLSSGLGVDGVLDQLATVVDPSRLEVRLGDVSLTGDRRIDGASRSFDVGGSRFSVIVDSGDRPDVLLPIAAALGTVVVAGIAVAARRGERRHRARHDVLLDRQARLADLGRRLAAADSTDDVVDVAVNHAGAVVDADHTNLGRLDPADPTKLLVLHDEGMMDQLRHRYLVQHLDERLPLSDSVRSTETVAIADRAAYAARYPHVMADIERAGIHAVRCVPISLANAMTFAVMGFAWRRPMSGPELAEYATAADAATELVGRALERALIAEAVQDQAGRLSRLAQALAVAQTTDQIAAAVERWLPSIVGARTAVLSPPAPPPSGEDSPRTTVPLRQDRSGGARSLQIDWLHPAGVSPTALAVLGTVVELVEAATLRSEQHAQEHGLLESLQHALLIPPPTRPGLEIAVRYEPAISALGIGGDWYEIVAVTSDVTGVVVGDVTGHGTDAVTVMAELKAIVHHLLLNRTPLREVCAHVDVCLRRHDTFATAFIGTIDTATNRLAYVRAGHVPPLLRRGGRVEALTGGSRPLLGLAPASSLGDVGQQPFEPGDCLLLYTDGLVEDRHRALDQSIAALAAVVADADPEPDRLLADCFAAAGQRSASARTDDDIAAIAVRRTGP